MANATDRLVGGVMVATAASVFTYYTLWALVTPFLPTDSVLQSLFPSREWAVRIPAVLLVIGASGIGTLAGLVLVAEARKGKRRRAA